MLIFIFVKTLVTFIFVIMSYSGIHETSNKSSDFRFNPLHRNLNYRKLFKNIIKNINNECLNVINYIQTNNDGINHYNVQQYRDKILINYNIDILHDIIHRDALKIRYDWGYKKFVKKIQLLDVNLLLTIPKILFNINDNEKCNKSEIDNDFN